MNRRTIISFALLAFFVLASTGWSLAQDPEDIAQGIKAYGTYRGGDIDSVSMTNGNLIVDIPLVSYPQRGKLQPGNKLVYNGKNYKQRTSCQAEVCTTYVDRVSFGSPLAPVSEQGFATKETTFQDAGFSNLTFTVNSLVAPDGASHMLASFSSTGNGLNETVDGTGLQYYNPVSGTSFATDANGTKYNGSVPLEDANGNQITTTTDTVGRPIPSFPLGFNNQSNGAGACPSGPLPVNANTSSVVPGPNGGSSTFLFCWALVNVVTIYDVTDGTQVNKNVNFIQSVVLPNGTAWTFQYSNDGFGDLTEITFPTGGTISYVWENGVSCTGMLIPPRWLHTRTVNANDGTGNHTWNYTYPGTTNVSDPLGNNTVYTIGAGSGCNGYTTLVQYYQGAVQSANLIKTVATAYNQTPSPFSQYLGTDFMNIVPTQITTTWYSNGQAIKTSQTTKSYDSGFTFPSPRPNDNTQYTGLYGKVLVQKDYDYGPGLSPGPLLRQTNTSYAWQSPNPNYASYLSNNMLNLVYSTQITDGTNQMAYTQYGYDETATIPSGMGAAQNLDLSVWTGTFRGNQTSVNRWLNLPTVQTLRSTTTYYDTGMPSVAKDALLNPTTYSYSSTFQDAYVTQVQNALSQSIYFNYDFNTGLKTSTTDLNGQVTTDSYDIDWRLVNDARPTGGGQTSFCYTDLGGATCSQAGAPYQVVINKQITSTLNETATATVDGVGRLAQTQLNSDPDGMDNVVDTYDGAGNKATTTNPYRTTSDATLTVWITLSIPTVERGTKRPPQTHIAQLPTPLTGLPRTLTMFCTE
jgi:YD repeat-containing protein